MPAEVLASNLLSPPVLFFVLGLVAALVASDLEVPAPVSKLFSLYLLLAIGFKGGVELRKTGASPEALGTIGVGMVLALVIPFYVFALLKRRLKSDDAAALAAAYGSVSAVTFIAATSFLTQQGLVPGGHLVATMALMESPAILVGIALARFSSGEGLGETKHLAKEALLNGSVLLLLGSLVIGLVAGTGGEKALEPFVNDLFKGFLCLFLLDMGLAAGRHWGALKAAGKRVIALGVIVPLLNAALALALCWLFSLSLTDTVMLTCLAASASYIAVPAAMRLALPNANPGLYLGLALGVTFPFNVTIGIPLYLWLAQRLTG